MTETGRNGPGRPKIPLQEKRRETVALRLTTDELKRLRDEASFNQKAPAVLAREIVLRGLDHNEALRKEE